MKRHLLLALLLAPLASPSSPAAPAIFGNVAVTQVDGADTAASVTQATAPGGSSGFTLGATSRGDYDIDFGSADDVAAGMLMTAVSQNSRDNAAFGDTFAGGFVATSASAVRVGDAARYTVAIFRAAQGDEVNVNYAFGYFPYADWLAGTAYNSANGGAITSLRASPGIALGTQLIDNGNGQFVLDLSTLGAAASSGVLLVNGAKNEDNFALSRANADGTFTIFNHDNGSDGGSYEQDPVGFVFISAASVGDGPIAALGRVNNDTTTDVAAGAFTVTKGGTGQWYLTIPGHNHTTGVLLVSPEGGVGNNVDNVVTCGWDAANNRWIVESKDISGAVNTPTRQNMGNAGDDVFSFAFLTTAPINAAPTATITSPADNAVFADNAVITLEATAADSDGTVAKVAFYDGTTLLGEDTTAPYTFAWSGAAIGTHRVTARATDNGGAVGGSAAILVQVQPAPGTEDGLYLDGYDDYVTFGNNPALGLTTITLETWFRRFGPGSGASTGSGGVTAVPLISKGRGENDSDTFNCNYLIGLRTSDGVIVADFEEGPGGSTPGLNHPVIGATPVTDSEWHHVAVTYDGATWRIYLDGNLDAELFVGQQLAFNSIQHSALGSALDSAGTPSGYFHGVMDEVRIWNVARTQTEIQGTMNFEVPASTGLIGRWSMTKESGGTLTSSAEGNIAGTLIGGPVWTSGKALDTNALPVVALDSPADGASVVIDATVELTATASDPDGTIARVEFYDGSTKLGEDTSAPYAFSWTATGFGPHELTARATDNDGGTAVSTVATVAVAPASGTGALYFDGVNDYVTFGDDASLKLATFTLETWFRRVGEGVATGTGSGGVSGVPLIAKGRGENDNDTFNCNYFIGIHPTDNVIVADFEEGAGGTSPGLNHPVTGVTPIPADGAWHHVAVTYDGTTWRVYVDGNLDAELAVGQPVAANSIQHASLGAALISTGAPAGAFHGFLDETRIWNVARTAAEIQSTLQSEVASAPGLVARWPMTEGSGTALDNSAGTAANGTLVNGPLWTAGAPLTGDVPPSLSLVAPADGAISQPATVELQTRVDDTDSSNLTVTVYGRPVGPAVPGNDFTIIALPDTQYYSASANGGDPSIFSAQTDWIVSEIDARNIQFVMHLGDITDHGDSTPHEWVAASNAMYRLENPDTTLLTQGLPYAVTLGNHDQWPNGDADGTTTYFNQYFGVHPTLGTNHFDGKSYYGGTRVPETADDNYVLFSASGLDFICINLEYDTSPDQEDLDWADSLLKAHPNRRAIVITHHMVNTGNPASFSTLGRAIYDALKDNPNLMLMHGGHIHGEGRRADTFGGNTVHSILADYQGRTRGGDGWLRILDFSPANNEIRIKTYSPTLNQFETDADSEFTLSVDLHGGIAPFTVVATRTGVAPGETVSIPWSDLAAGTRYEWFATVSDGTTTIESPLRSFTTGGVAIPPTVELTSPANGSAFAEPGAIALAADASDLDGTVTKVAFYSGTTLLGEDTTAPYTYEWTGVPAGSYTLFAKAIDNDGAERTSAAIGIVVQAQPPAPDTAGLSVGRFGSASGAWNVQRTTPAPRDFDQPGSDVGDLALRIHGTSVAFADGVTLAANHGGPTSAAADNLAMPYNGGGFAWVSVLDNTNNNAADGNPGTSEQTAGAAAAFLPYADGWVGASVAASGSVISGNLPAGVSVSRIGTGLYQISGLPVQGNVIATPNGDNGSTDGDNVASVRVVGLQWQVELRDNGAFAQDGLFAFVYVPLGTAGVQSGLVDATGGYTALNQDPAALTATVTPGAGYVDLTFGDGTVVNPANAALFLVGDTTSDATAADNLWSYSAQGNTFRVFTQDLPQLNGSFEPASFRFLVLPFGPPTVTLTATDDAAGETGVDHTLVFTATRTGDTYAALSVPLTVSGTATVDSDYSGFTSSLVIPAGASSASLTLTALADNANEGDETVTLALGTSDAFLAGTPATDAATIHDRPLQAWLAENLPGSSRQGPNDDADGDALSNFLEYAFDTAPAAPNRTGLPVLAVDAGKLTLTFTRIREELTYTVQASNDLQSWGDLAVNPGSVGSPVTVTDTNTTSPNRYLRLHVSEGADVAATVPAGRLTYTFPQNRETSLSFPLHGALDVIGGQPAGFITGVATTTLDNAGAGWTPGQLSQPATPYAVRITSGKAAGWMFPIDTARRSQNTATRLYLVTGGVNLGALGIKTGVDTYELVPADTLGSLFPKGTLRSGSPATGDSLRVWNGSEWVTYYHDGASWKRVGGGAESADHTLVRPGQGWMLLRRGASTTFTLIGQAPDLAKVSVPRSRTSFVSLLPVAQTFAEFALQTRLTAWASKPADPTGGDHVRLWSDTAWSTYYYDGALWRKEGGTDASDTLLLKPGRPVMIVRPTGKGTDTLTQEGAY